MSNYQLLEVLAAGFTLIFTFFSLLIIKFSSKNRKLKPVWTVDSCECLKAVHNISAEKELSALLAEEIRKEIDKEVLEDLRNYTNPKPTIKDWPCYPPLSNNLAWPEPKNGFKKAASKVDRNNPFENLPKYKDYRGSKQI